MPIPSWGGAPVPYSEYRTLVELWSSVTNLPFEKLAPILALNLYGPLKELAMTLGIPALSQSAGASERVEMSDIESTRGDVVGFLRIKRQELDVGQFLTQFRLAEEEGAA